MANILRYKIANIRAVLARTLLNKEEKFSKDEICAKAAAIIIDCEYALDAAIHQKEGWEILAQEALRNIRKSLI